MSKFNIASLKAKINIASHKARFKSVRKHRTRFLQVAAVVVLVAFLLWLLNDLLDGALLTALLFIIFVVGFCALIFWCAPEQSVGFVEQVIEGSKAHWARVKRSIKELRKLLTNKSPKAVVDEEVETVAASGPSPAVSPAPEPAAPPASPASTSKPAKTTKTTKTTKPTKPTKRTPAAAPVPVKSSAAVAGGSDALGKVAAATSRRRRTGRALSMPGEGESDKS
jgi:hypothetical protein